MATIAERMKALEEKERQLRAKRELLENQVKQEARRLRNRQSIIVGAIMLDIAYGGPEEAKRFLTVLEKKVTRDQDKKALAPVLDDLRKIVAGTKTVQAGELPLETKK